MMGYTHYWRRPKNLDREAFLKTIADFRRILPELEKRNVIISGWNGEGEPEFGPLEFAFNGTRQKVVSVECDLSHETFRISRDREEIVIDEMMKRAERERSLGIVQEYDSEFLFLDFCKTNRKPYDMAVMVALLLFKHHFDPEDKGKVIITSDRRKEEWAPAFELVKEYFGYDVKEKEL